MNAATPPSPVRDARRPSVRHGAAALALVGLLAASGCTYLNPITTARPYVPSDGEDVRLDADISVSSLMVISAGEGEAGTLVARVVNGGTEVQRVTISSADADVDEVVEVPANATVAIGGAAGQAGVLEVLIDSVPVGPGLLVPMTVAVDGGAGLSVDVPVLDGTIEPYAEYLPAEEPEAPVVPSATPSATGLPEPATDADPQAEGGGTEGEGASGSASASSSTGGTRSSSTASSSG